jgi:hypothetical protein
MGLKKILGMITFKWTFVFLLFVFYSIIRLHNYDKIPGPSHAEELLYSWSGIYLIETGVPQSWSTLDYPKSAKVYDGIVGNRSNLFLPATLYRPWLDEPPLYSLMSGGVAHLYGDDRTVVLPVSHTRVPSMFASLAVMGLVFFVTFSFFGYWQGVLAMTVYGTCQILIFASRLSVPENMIALGVIGGLLLAKAYLKSSNKYFPWVWGLMSALLGLMKPTGFFMAPLGMFLSFTQKKWRDAVVILGVTLSGVAAYVYYGYSIDWNIFKNIVAIQGTRFAGWSGLGYIFTSPAYDIFTVNDGWYIFAMLASVFYIFKNHKSKNLWLVSLFFMYWVLVGLLSGTEGDLLPWYRYPFFPLLAVFGGLMLYKLIKKADFFSASIILGLLMSSRYFLMNAFRPTTPPNTFRIVFLLAMIPSLAYYLWKKKWLLSLSRIVIIGFLVLGVWYNVKYVYNSFEIRCESITCPFGKGNFFSEMKLPFLWRFLVIGDSKDMLTTKRPLF